MNEILHAIVRGLLHIICAPFAATCVFLALRYWGQHNRKVGIFVSGRHMHLVTTSGMAAWMLMTLREPIDAWFHWQPLWKGPTDQLSWIVGIGLWVWFMWRSVKMSTVDVWR